MNREADDDEDVEGGEGAVPASPRREMVRPVFAERKSGNALTGEEIEAFLVALAQCGMFNQAAYGVGRSPHTFRTLAMNDPGFCIQVDDALADYSEMLQNEAVRRGLHGVIEPQFGKVGRDEEGIIGWKRVYSDRLLELELKASNKMKYYPPNQSAGQPGGDDAALGPKTGVVLLPERSKSHEDWEREHGAAAKGKLSQKVTRPVIPRKDAGK